MPIPNLRDKLDQTIFDAITSRSLVYNTCWEDPAVDRRALALGPQDEVLVLTSAGCNALDYALQGPRAIHAVDANPRQNALLELKIVGIRRLGFDDYFRIFGEGRHLRFAAIYRDVLRSGLSDFARSWWDGRTDWFTSRRGSFYFHGLSGSVARGGDLQAQGESIAVFADEASARTHFTNRASALDAAAHDARALDPTANLIAWVVLLRLPLDVSGAEEALEDLELVIEETGTVDDPFGELVVAYAGRRHAPGGTSDHPQAAALRELEAWLT